ncbi:MULTISPECIES: LysE family translocator [Desulfococcus]|uniref:Lysine exporter protein (LYSE/YGGA) n=1 Tax=Desulfococcus multivorans DSM 2059 TaxID=1121405 RepID=S7TD37_DESML|nr:LysE family translocator [Desulfococcus multivorans]AOY57110.1 lysine exporter protein (LYSE/YGGA) [Desulfococcus multivorans]AQU99612.1 threonine transporter RhtB [Desulfococcus multivorans]EPR34470.1 Lysine exporter protein (LYSE/YGGA) [Desulfococcus multivorans DSM 2059]SJZ87336.1 Threonine/homoserine/homoserine lactone efflux protein [Desulfococcus multivorans DSM 2059]
MDPQFRTYLIAVTLLTLTPGVDTLLIIRNAGRGGWRDGAVSSFGICTGLFVHAAVSAVGISVILLQSALAFSVLKLAGAGYLIWLGAASLRHAWKPGDTPSPSFRDVPPLRFSPRRSFVEGFLSNVLNPKAVVFYMAFLPQFIDPSGSALRQSLFLAGLHFVVAMVWQCFLALIVNRAGTWLKRRAVHRTFDGLTGSVMLFLGVRLAMAR